MMNSLYNGNNFVVRLRGLPWNSNQNDVQNFLQGCRIRQTEFVTNDQGRSTGECFVVLETKEDVDIAKNFDKKIMGTRYIEVFDSNAEAMSEARKNSNTNDSTNQQDNESWYEPVVRLRGLPYKSSKEDVIKFFDGLDIAQNGVHISSSKPAGEAFVAFTNMDNALRALEFNRMNMGHRYIEVFKSTYAEARASIMVDTQSIARQKGTNPPQRQGSFAGNNSNTNIGNNYNNNMNPYNNGPPPSNNYSTYSDNGNNYPMNNNNNNGSGSLKRTTSVAFTMKMRGVPFEAGEKDIYDFFSPVVPIRLDQETTPRGKPPIWYAEFGSREEATEAMTFHKKYMGTRYIELLPLYDELNRSKMIRT